MTTRIAMWSGPRNISTALMRAWENRDDCAVIDEPLYAHYLCRTGLDHPGVDEVLASQPTDWRVVIGHLTGPVPQGRSTWYQKHMVHHLLPGVDREWLSGVVNCFLLRDPASVAVSYDRTRPDPTLEDLGFPQLVALFRFVTGELGQPAIVVDSADVLGDPRGTIGLLCEATGVPFSERMLSWPAGPRSTDGVWGRHWYEGVWRSTGFGPSRPVPSGVPDRLQGVVDAARPLYRELYEQRLGC